MIIPWEQTKVKPKLASVLQNFYSFVWPKLSETFPRAIKVSNSAQRPGQRKNKRQRRTRLVQLPVALAQFDHQNAAMFADGLRAPGGDADDPAVEYQHPEQGQHQDEKHGRDEVCSITWWRGQGIQTCIREITACYSEYLFDVGGNFILITDSLLFCILSHYSSKGRNWGLKWDDGYPFPLHSVRGVTLSGVGLLAGAVEDSKMVSADN